MTQELEQEMDEIRKRVAAVVPKRWYPSDVEEIATLAGYAPRYVADFLNGADAPPIRFIRAMDSALQQIEANGSPHA